MALAPLMRHRLLFGSEEMKVRTDLNQHVDAVAAAIDLELRPAHRGGIIANLEVIFAHCCLVMDFALDDANEPAAIFRA